MLQDITQLTFDETNKYELLSCKAGESAIFVWGQEVENSVLDRTHHQIKGCIWKNYETTVFDLGSLDYYESLISIKEYSQGTFALIIESQTTSRIILIDMVGTIVKIIKYPYKNIVVRCYQSGNNVVLFCYDNVESKFFIQVTDLEWESEMTVVNTYYNVQSIPEVFIDSNDNYICAWLNHNIIQNTKTLYVKHNNVFVGRNDLSRVIPNFNVEYLISSRVDDEWIVFGGFDDVNEMMRFEFCSESNGELILYDRYVKNAEYDSHTYRIDPLDTGFILLGDGPERNTICGQRWNHLATPVYPTIDLTECYEIPTWSPTAVQIHDQIIIAYLKDFDSHDEIEIGTMTLGKEIDGLNIWDLC